MVLWNNLEYLFNLLVGRSLSLHKVQVDPLTTVANRIYLAHKNLKL